MAAFVTVAELRGFAPAARRLGLSPSAVTRLIAALEQRLATRLLHRTTRSVTLTDTGARYLERARKILRDVEEADGAVQAELRAPTGRLVVTAPKLFGRLAVAPLMSTYLARHPGVVGELNLSDRVVHIVADGIDIAVRIGALSDSSLHARKVGETRRVVVAAPAYLARHAPPRTPAELAGHTVVQFTPLQSAPEWRFPGGPGPRAVTIHPRMITNSAEAAIGHAERGGGLTMVLAYQVAEAVRAGRLAVVLAAFEPPPLPIHLVTPTRRMQSAKVRAFVELVRDTCDWRFVDL